MKILFRKAGIKAAVYAALLAASWPSLAVEIDQRKLTGHEQSAALDALHIEHFLTSPWDREIEFLSTEPEPDLELSYHGKGEIMAKPVTP